MEYKKASKGFTVEFNEEEEKHFETFVENLKKLDDYSTLSSNSEFFALIINEGVSALQQRTSTTINLNHFFENILNESLHGLLQYNEGYLAKESEFPVSLDDLLSILPNINSLYNAPDKLISEGNDATLNEHLKIGKDDSLKNIE